MSTDKVVLVANNAGVEYTCGTNGNVWIPTQGGVISKTATYTGVMGDTGKITTMNGASLTYNLPNPPPSPVWNQTVSNLNASVLTVSRNGLLIDGSSTNISLSQFQSVYFSTDGTNWFSSRGQGTGSSTTGLTTTGLLAEYRMPSSESSTTVLTDYAGSNDGTFAGGAQKPTRLASGSISCNGAATQFISLPAGVNTANSWMFAFTWNVGDQIASKFNALMAQNTTPTANTVDYFGFMQTLAAAGNLIQENAIVPTLFNASAISNGTGAQQGTHIIAYVADTTDRIYIDGVELALYGNAVANTGHLNPSPNNFQLCGGSFNSAWFTGQLHYVAAWATVLTPAQVAQNANIIKTALAQKGVLTVNGQSGANATADNIMLDGDSIMQGSDDNNNGIPTWPTTLQLGSATNVWNAAISGSQLVSGEYPNINQNPLGYYSNSSGRNAVAVNGGRNDYAVAALSTAYVTGTRANYCRVVRIAGLKCFIVTQISIAGNAASKNTDNAYFRQHKELYDLLIDWGGDPNIGCDTCTGNAFFRGDNIHPNSYSNRTILGHIIQKAVNMYYGPSDFTTATTYVAAAVAANTVTATSQAGNIATYTFAANLFALGQFVTCTGITPAGYNTTFRVLSLTGTQITGWLNTTGLGAGSVFGSCTAPQQAEERFSVLNFGAGNFNLQPCDGITGTRINVKNINAVGSTLNAYNTTYETDLIDGAATLAIAQNQVRILESVLATPSTPVCSWKVIQ